jgi:hypothetical protein
MHFPHLGVFVLLFGSCLPAAAGTYEALCGSTECTIVLTPEAITTPYGIIPTTRVANWGGSGSSSQDLVLGAAATYVFGPVGLVGFLAKTHDYNYMITGYDQLGDRTSVQIQFQNSMPAKRFVQEMVAITGLGMGQTRTAIDIKELEKRVAIEGLKAIHKPRLTLQEQYSKEMRSQSSLTSSKNAPRCWSLYLSENSDIAKWVRANPIPSKSLQEKYADC